MINMNVWEQMQRRVPQLAIEPDEWLRRMMRWHFSEETASPFWLEKRQDLCFNPLEDIHTLKDMELFGRFKKDELRTVSCRKANPTWFFWKESQGFRNWRNHWQTLPYCRRYHW